MDVEIVEFYPITKEEGRFAGSLHVYIIDLHIDLRGIYVTFDQKRETKWKFTFPWIKTVDFETKEEVKFPVIQFSDRKKNFALMKQIRYRGKPYIQKNFLGMDVEEPPKAEKKPFVKKPFVKRPFNPNFKKKWDKKESDKFFLRNR